MAVNTRPYFIIYNGVPRMVEAPNNASAVRHVVGAAVTELRPARGAEVAAWVRAENKIEVAGEKAVTAAADATMPEIAAVTERVDPDPVKFFEDWAGYDRAATDNSLEASETLSLFKTMVSTGQLDLMTFDILRERAPEFGFAMIAAEAAVPRTDDATYVAALDAASESGLASLRARLEEQPMPAADVVRAIITHAGQGDVEEAMVGNTGHLDDGQ